MNRLEPRLASGEQKITWRDRIGVYVYGLVIGCIIAGAMYLGKMRSSAMQHQQQQSAPASQVAPGATPGSLPAKP